MAEFKDRYVTVEKRTAKHRFWLKVGFQTHEIGLPVAVWYDDFGHLKSAAVTIICLRIQIDWMPR